MGSLPRSGDGWTPREFAVEMKREAELVGVLDPEAFNEGQALEPTTDGPYSLPDIKAAIAAGVAYARSTREPSN